jgi:ABC-type lipoprotein release transport system permease subunit
LAPWNYLVRNAGKTAPLVGVIVLAVLLIAGIVSMMNSIPLSIKTIYSYSRYSLGITPRGDPSMTPAIRAIIEREAPVPIERIAVCRASSAEVRSIVGKWPFVVIGLEADALRYVLRRLGGERLEGRLPVAGKPEAVISEPVARNLNLRIGDELLGPEQDEAYSPQSVRVVGIAQTDQWTMLSSYEYYAANHLPPVDLLMVFARDLRDQERLDRWATERFKGERAQIFAYHELEKSTDEMFDILYKILNVVIGTLVLVITLMMGMLMNIYLSQRTQEFGLLQALGYTKRRLLRRVFGETLIVVVGGWLLGLAAAVGLLHVVDAALMHPQAFALDTLDRTALLYTAPVPIAIFATAWLTVRLRFQRFDPVGVVERRLV